MKQSLFKRRRVLSNLHTSSLSSESFVSSLKTLRISTCTSCHRTVGLKSGPAFLCARCNVSTCAICLRTCTSGSVSSSQWAGSLNLVLDSATIPRFQSNTNTSRRRRPRDEDSDNIFRMKDVDNDRSGCGQMVCRKCCFEHPQSGAIACLDCSEKQLALKTHQSNDSMY